MINIYEEFKTLNLSEESDDYLDKVLSFMHKHVSNGIEPTEVAKQIENISGKHSSRELVKLYKERFKDLPKADIDQNFRNNLIKKYGGTTMNESNDAIRDAIRRNQQRSADLNRAIEQSRATRTPSGSGTLRLTPDMRVNDTSSSSGGRNVARTRPSTLRLTPDMRVNPAPRASDFDKAPRTDLSQRDLSAAQDRGSRAISSTQSSRVRPRVSLASRALSGLSKIAGPLGLATAIATPDDLGDGTFSGNTGIDASTPEGYFAREAEIRRMQRQGLGEEKEVWDTPNPKKKSEKLSPAAKAKAKARARKAGRKYPNLVDNMWAARNEEVQNSEPVSSNPDDSSSRFIGTDSLTNIYASGTPGQADCSKTYKAIKKTVKEHYEDEYYIEEKILEALNATENTPRNVPPPQDPEYKSNFDQAVSTVERLRKEGENPTADQVRGWISPRIRKKHPGLADEIMFNVREENLEERELTNLEKTRREKYVKGMKKHKAGFKKKYGKDAESVMYATATKLAKEETEITEATYKGKKVKLNKPFKTPGGPKKSAVYVDPDGDGKAKIVRFGDPNMSIKKDQPGRKKSYCARSSGQGNLKDKGSANYWSRKAWDC